MVSKVLYVIGVTLAVWAFSLMTLDVVRDSRFFKVLSAKVELRKVLKEGEALLLAEAFLRLVDCKVKGEFGSVLMDRVKSLDDKVAWEVLLIAFCKKKSYLKWVKKFPYYDLIGKLDFTDALIMFGVCI